MLASAPGARKAGKKPRPAKDLSKSVEKGKAKQVEKEVDGEEEDGDEDEDNDDLEESYAAKKSGTAAAASQSALLGDDGSDEEFVHETLAKDIKAKAKKDRGKKKDKWVPEGETSEERDKRTIFVGNVDVEVVKNKVRRDDGQRR